MSKPTLPTIANQIYTDTLQSIIHSTLLSLHHEHKLLLRSLDPATKLPLCDRCGLPRQLDPPLAPKVRGATTDPPRDTQYCERRPWCRAPGFDVYGNPFPRADVTGRPPTKKEREAAAAAEKKNGGNGSGQDGTNPPSPSEGAGDDGAPGRKLEKGEKKASKIDEKLKKGEYVPWQTCPSCKRSLLVTRFAKHLEGCMELGGSRRAAAKGAMARINGTPTPSQGDAEEGEEGEGIKEEGPVKVEAKSGNGKEGGVRKKVLKKGMKDKIATAKAKKDKDSNGSSTPTMSKKDKAAAAAAAAAGRVSEGKRERPVDDSDDDGDNVVVKKRQKLQRVESSASLLSASGVGGDAERRGSVGGSSFVDMGDEGSVGTGVGDGE